MYVPSIPWRPGQWSFSINNRRYNPVVLIIAACLLPATLSAGEPCIIEGGARCDADRNCDFSVTLRHNDEGWDHYADRWEILDEAGNIIATRVLAHPHVNEQPFTRSLKGVKVPAGIERVLIRAHDSVHGYGSQVVELTLPTVT